MSNDGVARGAGSTPAVVMDAGPVNFGEGGNVQVTSVGGVIVNDKAVDVSTNVGLAALKAALPEEDVGALKGMLQLKEVDGPEGNILVANDVVDHTDTELLGRVLGGPLERTQGQSETDKELSAWFTTQKDADGNDIADPYNSQTTPQLFSEINDTLEFLNAVAAAKVAISDPSVHNTGAFNNSMMSFHNPAGGNTLPPLTPSNGVDMSMIENQSSGLTSGDFVPTPTDHPANNMARSSAVKPSKAFDTYMFNVEASQPHGNIMEVLFLVFRASIEETNEDKKYFLIKLQEFNKMGEMLSDYLSELVEVSRQLGTAAAGAKYPEMVTTASPVTIKKFDLNTLSTDGKLVPTKVKAQRLDRAGLNDTIKEVESMQETVRNKRQMASTAFQNFDQKSNQLYNLMSSVMKSFNEMRSGVVRNLV